MTAPDRLGVVIPALDEAEVLPRLLARLRTGAAEDRADEVVVVDGGSRDGTVELARAAGAVVVRTERGRGRQLAAGAEATSAELLLFLHADTVPAPGALVALRAAFRDPSVNATGMAQRIDAHGFLFRWIERAANARVRRFGLVYGDSGLAVRHEVYRAVGGFSDLPLFEDVDLSRRLARSAPGASSSSSSPSSPSSPGDARPRFVPEARLHVSPRRWQREGVIRSTARNWLLTVGYALGVDPNRLARFYSLHSAGRRDGRRGNGAREESTGS